MQWYLTTMDFVIGDFPTKHEALQNIGALKIKCHRKPYGYSIDIKDESDGWLCDAIWLMKNRENLIKHGFLSQLSDYENIREEDVAVKEFMHKCNLKSENY